MKKFIKAFLCGILIFAVLCVNVCCFADCRSDELIYVSLGDSIADGIGLPANPLRGPDQPNKSLVYCHKTEGAYPVLVARQSGIRDSNFYQLACAGMRTVELRRCLDKSYVMPDSNANNFQNGELDEYVLRYFDYVDAVSAADIITMNMCANDIATCALFSVRSAMAASGISDMIIDRIAGCEIRNGEHFSALAKLL